MTGRSTAPDAGFTLIEVLVGMMLFSLLGTLLIGIGISTSRSGDDVEARATVGEEARLGMERLTRELRQASAVAAVTLPQAPGDQTRLTVYVNLDGNGCIATSGPAVSVEKITYTYDPGTDELMMQVSGLGSPLLATKVTEFGLELDSSAWEYDANHDGVTTSAELDASSIGNHQPLDFTSTELANIDLIKLAVTTTDGGHDLHYATSVDLRNQQPNQEPTPCA